MAIIEPLHVALRCFSQLCWLYDKSKFKNDFSFFRDWVNVAVSCNIFQVVSFDFPHHIYSRFSCFSKSISRKYTLDNVLEAYLEPCKTSKMELFAKTIKVWKLVSKKILWTWNFIIHPLSRKVLTDSSIQARGPYKRNNCQEKGTLRGL